HRRGAGRRPRPKRSLHRIPDRSSWLAAFASRLIRRDFSTVEVELPRERFHLRPGERARRRPVFLSHLPLALLAGTKRSSHPRRVRPLRAHSAVSTTTWWPQAKYVIPALTLSTCLSAPHPGQKSTETPFPSHSNSRTSATSSTTCHWPVASLKSRRP